MPTAPRPHSHHSGFSYLELCIAIVILSLCIVPAARMLPSLLAGQRDLETQYHLSLVAQQKLEATVLTPAPLLLPGTEHGTLTDEGHPTWHYDILIEPEGLLPPPRYIDVRVRAWVDLDGGIDIVPGLGDPQVRYDTRVANRQRRP